MADDLEMEEGGEMTRYHCPNCAKPFDAAVNKWESGDILCPYCGAEIEG